MVYLIPESIVFVEAKCLLLLNIFLFVGSSEEAQEIK